MSYKFLLKTSFHELLTEIDQDLAIKCQKAGCPHCGGQLHQAAYPRSPHGVFKDFREYYQSRFSFCCANCRKRTSPETVRFFGRYWHVAPVLILISALSLGINDRRLKQIKIHLGVTVSESTWKRWRKWWGSVFCTTPFWQQSKGLLSNFDEEACFLPRDLLILFKESLDKKMVRLLKFLSPLTAGGVRAI